MANFIVRPLSPETWEAFATLVEANNGVWGGCWCIGFHGPFTSDNRARKLQMVQEGKTHAALVFDGDIAVGWCQFGPTADLPRIKHRKQYEAELEKLPDWRITCFFVGKGYRKKGVADKALEGALDLIRKMGGGLVESYPEDVTGRRVSGSFLYNATLSTFERQGFVKQRRLGQAHWVVTKVL